jgi:hypothetical protein
MRLMDASNFYIALFDEQAAAVLPLYADQQDPAPPEPESYSGEQNHPLADCLADAHGQTAGTRQRLLEVCQQEQLVLEGPVPELWMGVPLTNVSNAVIGAAVLQFYANQALHFGRAGLVPVCHPAYCLCAGPHAVSQPTGAAGLVAHLRTGG